MVYSLSSKIKLTKPQLRTSPQCREHYYKWSLQIFHTGKVNREFSGDFFEVIRGTLLTSHDPACRDGPGSFAVARWFVPPWH